MDLGLPHPVPRLPQYNGDGITVLIYKVMDVKLLV